MFHRDTVHKPMTDAQKGRIISMYFDSQLPVQTICRELGCSKRTIYKWVNKYHTDGDVVRKKPPGRPNITTPAQDAAIVQVDNLQNNFINQF